MPSGITNTLGAGFLTEREESYFECMHDGDRSHITFPEEFFLRRKQTLLVSKVTHYSVSRRLDWPTCLRERMTHTNCILYPSNFHDSRRPCATHTASSVFFLRRTDDLNTKNVVTRPGLATLVRARRGGGHTCGISTATSASIFPAIVVQQICTQDN